MRLDLELIPTSSQRKAIITEVVQNLIKIGSAMISPRNLDTWRDVGEVEKELSTISSYVTALENELSHFVDCVINKQTPLVSVDDGIRALEVAIEIEKLINQGI